MQIRQETNFPDTDHSELLITTEKAKDLTFHIRYPEWATEGYSITINGEVFPIDQEPGSFVSISRTWDNEDKIVIEMIKSLRTEPLLGDDHKSAFLNGPIVLAGETNPAEKHPVFLHENEDVSVWVKPTDANKTTFRTQTGLPSDINLLPFYKKYQGVYSIYFDCFTPEEWDQVKEEYEKEQEELRELERLTLDIFRPNEQQQEIDHQFTGTNVGRGDGSQGRKWCDSDGGYFSFRMLVDPKLPTDIMLTYWGSDSGNRKFDILVDDTVIATEELTGHKPDEFFDRRYAIPFHLTEGKSKVTLKLRAYSGNKAGGIFHARTILKKEVEGNLTILDFLYPKAPYLEQHNISKNATQRAKRGQNYIESPKSGGLSFDMTCSPDSPTSLLLAYWGNELAKKTFEIRIDGTTIATQELEKNTLDESTFDVIYEIPQEATSKKKTITVELFSTSSRTAGPLFYAYTFSKGPSNLHTIEGNSTIPFSVRCEHSDIWLQNKTNEPTVGTISIYAANGQLVYEEAVDFSGETRLNHRFNKGIFLLHFTSKQSAFYSTKLIFD